jgi:hypothetical protein
MHAVETDGLVWVGTIGPGDVFAQGGWLRRPVSWQESDPAPVAALPEEFGTVLERQGTVADITGALDAVRRSSARTHLSRRHRGVRGY